jgi:hypothetical protein
VRSWQLAVGKVKNEKTMKKGIFVCLLFCFFFANCPLLTANCLHSSPTAYRDSPNPFAQKFRKKAADNRRLIAACLAFPLPVGFLGAHRIFLGTNPYVPVAYAGTLGGCLGAIPLVDFFVIVFSKNFEQYENNPRFFMWIRKKGE